MSKADKIFFKQSLQEIIESQTQICLRGILNVLDICNLDSSQKSKLRSVILDNVNDLSRVSMNTIESIIENNYVRAKD